jgi:hypothetical protein
MIQNHPFQPSAHVNDSGEICVFPVQHTDRVLHCGKPRSEHQSSAGVAHRGNKDFDFEKMYYLAGPMSGYPDYNYPAFQAAAWTLRNTGIRIQSPHEAASPENQHTLTEEELWTEMMRRTHLQLQQCEGIILLKGWPQSRGARAELLFALEANWPVWYYHDFQLTNMNKEN